MYFFFTAKNKTKQGETHFKNYQCALLRAIVVIWFFSLKENLILSFELVISDVFFFFSRGILEEKRCFWLVNASKQLQFSRLKWLKMVDSN